MGQTLVATGINLLHALRGDLDGTPQEPADLLGRLSGERLVQRLLDRSNRRGKPQTDEAAFEQRRPAEIGLDKVQSG